jgi:hypothetical protein
MPTSPLANPLHRRNPIEWVANGSQGDQLDKLLLQPGESSSPVPNGELLLKTKAPPPNWRGHCGTQYYAMAGLRRNGSDNA